MGSKILSWAETQAENNASVMRPCWYTIQGVAEPHTPEFVKAG